MLDAYRDLAENYLAIPVITGEKSALERFAGADKTYTFEGLMPDGKALQMGTSHMLSQSFAAAFDVKFQDKNGGLSTPFCTSWGVTTRLIGALVMTHGDQNGLIIPPKVAPTQVVIVPIVKTEEQREPVVQAAQNLASELEKNNLRVNIDLDDQKTPGAKFYHWELRGIPVRIEIGPKDVEKQQAVVVNRIEQDKAKRKQFVALAQVPESLNVLLENIQKELYHRALQKRDAQWHQADALDDFAEKLSKHNGMYQTGWCGNVECEQVLKQYQGTIRCIVDDKKHTACFNCKQASVHEIVLAKAY